MRLTPFLDDAQPKILISKGDKKIDRKKTVRVDPLCISGRHFHLRSGRD